MATKGKNLKNKETIAKMTLEEKAQLCDGLNFWYTKSVDRLGVPSIMVSDGPHGLRKQNLNDKNDMGMSNSHPAVCFPTACTTACSWDVDLLHEMGKALGEECLKENVSVLLGPGANMKRSPLCGRNFEYFSEDPLLAGKLSAAYINGVQSMGVGTSLKHFAANSQETRRLIISSIVDERALREIYFTAFEIAVKESNPWTVMSSYNKINGVYSTENDWLQNKVLRDEWGFDGVVVSDWGAVNDRVEGMKSGNDLEMPSSQGINSNNIINAVQSGELDESVVDKRVDTVLDLVNKSQTLPKKEYTCDLDAHHELAAKIAAQSMVLLKNDGVLPVSKGQKLSIVGEMAKKPRYQGAGSSEINPTKIDNAVDCLKEAGFDITYSQGYINEKNDVNRKLIDEAVESSKNADVVLAFIGLTQADESEGFDRETMALSESHNELVNALCDACENVVVILAGGSPVSMPWVEKVQGLVNSYLGGQAGARAVADIITGEVNPSGKLAETYPFCKECTPCADNFPGGKRTVEHRESIYIGYRYYEKAKEKVQFPFGFGLSYTQFEYSDLKLDKSQMSDDESLCASVKVKNTGKVAGAEIIQLYVADEESTIFRPEKELRGFKKVKLNPNEEKTVDFVLDKRAFAYYNTQAQCWHVESGSFEIVVGSSSADIRLRGKVDVSSTQPEIEVPDFRETAKSYYTGDVKQVPDTEFEALLGMPIPPSDRDITKLLDINDSLEDAKHTKWGRRINRLVDLILRRFNKGYTAEMVKTAAFQNPLRFFIFMSNGLVTQKMLDGLLLILNDKRGGWKKLLSGIPHLIKNAKKVLGGM
ncbi:MAG TPA: glycoside hydrolase family 3 C-terminal domain-containing protein [Clostridia bacterium]|nr:glycoside hydrolase family 3 C-terminal domain-containing protein [Clostridia bacterium]